MKNIKDTYFTCMHECFKNLEKCFSYLAKIYTDPQQDCEHHEDESSTHTEWTSRRLFNALFNVPADAKDRVTILNFKKFDNIIHHRCATSTVFNVKIDLDMVYDMVYDLYPNSTGDSMILFLNSLYYSSKV